jgi:hypothetical protein
MPLRLAGGDGKGIDAQIDLVKPQFQEAWPADRWKLKAGAGDKIQTVARSDAFPDHGGWHAEQ